MKYWLVWFDNSKYQLRCLEQEFHPMERCDIAIFKSFDMAYEYVTKLNGTTGINQTYSRWTVRR